MKDERVWPTVVVGWILAVIVLVLVSVPQIAALVFPDPDDAMRMLEVRDWLAGQSWWDVGQHRLNGGDWPMHWSRLVDLPVAAWMVIFDPLLGQAASTRIAMVAVPLLTLLAVMVLTVELTRRLLGAEVARLAVLLTPICAPLLVQLRPLRIDHHGWQIVCALLAVVMLIGRPTRRSGLAIGGALATLVTISLEGLPISVAMAGVTALAAALDARRRPQAIAALLSLLGGVVALHVATRGPGMWAPACDAVAPAWIAAMAVAALGGAVALGLMRGRLTTLAGLAVAGAAGAVTVKLLAPICLAGPFATLDPIVYRLWYLNIEEGLPFWEQQYNWLSTGAGLVAGAIGAVLAFRQTEGEARERWLMAGAVQAAALVLALLVARAGATANALAIPGCAFILSRLLSKARAVPDVPRRVVALLGAYVAASPGLVVSAVLATGWQGSATAASPPGAAVVGSSAQAGPGGHQATLSVAPENMDVLSVLPPGPMFAPVDTAPEIIAETGHDAVAAGYHRGSHAIARVMTAFTSPPARARAIILASGAEYVVGCPGLNETQIYKRVAPDGLWARLERGERFDWLQPIAIPNSPVLAWRIIRPSHALGRQPLSMTALRS